MKPKHPWSFDSEDVIHYFADLLGTTPRAFREVIAMHSSPPGNYYNAEFYLSKELRFYVGSKSVVEGLIDEWLPAKSRTVLDVGCGAGFYARALQRKSQIYVGFDYSGSGVRMARAFFPESRMNFLQADGTRLPLKDASIDHAFSTEVIEHIQDVFQVLSELHRVLKPGGRLLLTTTTFQYYLIDILIRWSYLDLIVSRDLRRFARRLVLYARGYGGPEQRSQFMRQALERTDHCHAFTYGQLRDLLVMARFQPLRHLYFTVKDVIPGTRFAPVRTLNAILRRVLRVSRIYGPNIAVLCEKVNLPAERR